MSTLKKLIIWLFVIMVISFSVSGYFFNKYGLLSQDSKIKNLFMSKSVNAPSYLNTQNFDMTDIENLSLDAANINVNIQQSNTVKEGTATLSGFAYIDSIAFDITRDNNQVSLVVTSKDNTPKTLKLDVIIPSDFLSSIAIDTTSGNCTANIIQCDTFQFNTASGNLNTSIIYADSLALNTESGNINISSIKGDLTAKTLSGNIETYYETFSDNIDIKTDSGNVNLGFESPVDFDLDFKSSFGEHILDVPVTIQSNSNKKTLRAISGNGNNKIKIKTISGNLRIR